jgi:O-glycosyl hydrolase
LGWFCYCGGKNGVLFQWKDNPIIESLPKEKIFYTAELTPVEAAVSLSSAKGKLRVRRNNKRAAYEHYARFVKNRKRNKGAGNICLLAGR